MLLSGSTPRIGLVGYGAGGRRFHAPFIEAAATGSYRSAGTDVQAAAISAGLRPTDDPAAWGREAAEYWGTLTTEAGSRPVPSEQGRWHAYYEQFGQAATGGGTSPVPAEQAVTVIEIIDAATTSAAENRVVVLTRSIRADSARMVR